MPDLPEHEARYIRDYVDSQSHDDKAGLVQKIGSRRVMGRGHDLYDVHCEHSRWWVITEPTNLYSQDDFPEVEQAFIFHLGLGIFMADRSRAELPPEEQVSGAWRRFKQALADMDDAGESEDFQAVGIKCRDALLAVVRDHRSAEWVGEVDEPPKLSDFKGWGSIFAERLAEARVRSYLKALVDTRLTGLAALPDPERVAEPVDEDLDAVEPLEEVGLRAGEPNDPDVRATSHTTTLTTTRTATTNPMAHTVGQRSRPES